MYQKNLLYFKKLFWSNLLPYFITTTEEVLSISRLNTLAKNLKFRRGNRNVLIETYLGKIEKGEEEPTSFEIIRHQYQIPKERKDILFLHNSLQLHIDCPGFNLLQKLAVPHGKANCIKNQLVEQHYYHFGIDSIWRAKSTFLYAEIALDERKSSLLQKISHIGYLSTLIPRIMSE